MTTFWIIAILLIIFGLVLMLMPFIKKGDAQQESVDQSAMNVDIAKDRLAELDTDLAEHRINAEEHKQIKAELESALYFDLEKQEQSEGDDNKGRLGMFAILIFVPVLSVSMYQMLGSPEGMLMVPGQQAQVKQEQAPVATQPSLKETLVELVAKLKKDPKDVEAWLIMGSTMMAIDRYKEAVLAFEKVLQFSDFKGTEKANVYISLADALAMNNEGSLDGRPDELIKKALALDENHVSALWLAGMSAERKGQHKVALAHWNKLYPLLSDADKEAKKTLEALMLAANNAILGIETPPSEPVVTVQPATLQLNITISDALKAQTKGNELLFIYAKAMSGPPMPLAALKLKVSDLPVKVSLDDSMAMMPQMRLSSFEKVVVGARVSKSGQPIAQVGDFEGEVSNVTVNNNNETINIVIDRVKK